MWQAQCHATMRLTRDCGTRGGGIGVRRIASTTGPDDIQHDRRRRPQHRREQLRRPHRPVPRAARGAVRVRGAGRQYRSAAERAGAAPANERGAVGAHALGGWRRLHGRRLCTRERPARRVQRDLRAGLHQPADGGQQRLCRGRAAAGDHRSERDKHLRSWRDAGGRRIGRRHHPDVPWLHALQRAGLAPGTARAQPAGRAQPRHGPDAGAGAPQHPAGHLQCADRLGSQPDVTLRLLRPGDHARPPAVEPAEHPAARLPARRVRDR